MADTNSPHSDEKVLVRRGRVDSVNLYEVKEHELELLERGATGTLQLNFAIFLFSTAFTCIVALVTTDFKWDIAKSIFVFTSVVGLILGAYLMFSWWQTRQSLRKIISTIRNRLNGEFTPTEIPESSETQSNKIEDNEEPHG